MEDSKFYVFFLLFAVLSVVALLKMLHEPAHAADGVRKYERHELVGQEKRDACAVRLNNDMEFMGIDARWSAEDETIMMKGELCDEHFIELFPKLVRDDIVASGFSSARCEGPNGSKHNDALL